MLDAIYQVPEALRNNLAFLLRVAAERANEVVDNQLSAFGLNARHVAILLLAEQQDMNQNTLAIAAKTHPNAIVSLLDALQEKGLARREQNASNRREYLVRVTPAGRRLLKSLSEATETAMENVTEKLTAEDRHDLTRLLLKLIEAWA